MFFLLKENIFDERSQNNKTLKMNYIASQHYLTFKVFIQVPVRIWFKQQKTE